MRSGLESAVRVAVTGTLLLALAGCGGDSPVPPMVVVTPEPVRGVLFQSSYPHGNDEWLQFPVLLSQRGVVDITVDWTFPDTWMYVYFGRTDCDYIQLTSYKCPFILSSETKTPKPRILYTESLEPGTYYLVLYNVPLDRHTGIGSYNTESVAVQLGLTVSASGQRSTDAVHLGRPIVVSPPRL
jgi:hypothetical protein